MSDFFGEFSFPKFIELLPVYAGLGLIFYQIKSARKDAARRAAFDFSFSVFRSERHINCRRDYCKLQIQEPFPENLFKTLNAQGNQLKFDLLTEYLDFQEMFSIGVLNGGISKKFAREGYNLIVAEDWKYLRNFIFEMRTNDKEPDLYSNFEKLAKKWNK